MRHKRQIQLKFFSILVIAAFIHTNVVAPVAMAEGIIPGSDDQRSSSYYDLDRLVGQNFDYDGGDVLHEGSDAYNALAALSGRFGNLYEGARNYVLGVVDAWRAWEFNRGEGQTIAILDSGVTTDHLDLADNVWVNKGEIAGDGIDNDNNGHIDDTHGWNFGDDNNDVSDINGHGTHVAGISSASGLASDLHGIAPDSNIMSLRVFKI